jgi:deoxyribodipyrimidine photolyase-related protein
MRDDELDLFHSKTSALVNLSRILPSDLVNDTVAAYAAGKIPLASAEGFIRQVLGWREFMRHLHRVTDGYRHLPKANPVFLEKGKEAAPSALHATRPLPAAYWGVKSGLHCLDTVVQQVVDEGWSHHITRLMVLSNLATLCGFSPRELTDWFWFAYVDAYDWVVEPNVLGMSTYADGGLTATKPYVSGAAYIHRMSNYCGHCQYDPKKSTGPGSCPFTALYWTFLERNEQLLGKNQRLAMPYNTLRKKSAAERKALRDRADQAIAELAATPRDNYRVGR